MSLTDRENEVFRESAAGALRLAVLFMTALIVLGAPARALTAESFGAAVYSTVGGPLLGIGVAANDLAFSASSKFVYLRNPFTIYRIPWSAIKSIDSRGPLVLTVCGGRTIRITCADENRLRATAGQVGRKQRIYDFLSAELQNHTYSHDSKVAVSLKVRTVGFMIAFTLFLLIYNSALYFLIA